MSEVAPSEASVVGPPEPKVEVIVGSTVKLVVALSKSKKHGGGVSR